MKNNKANKCEGVNLGRELINDGSREYEELNEISLDGSRKLQKQIKGPYRYGCI